MCTDVPWTNRQTGLVLQSLRAGGGDMGAEGWGAVEHGTAGVVVRLRCPSATSVTFASAVPVKPSLPQSDDPWAVARVVSGVI